MHINIETLLAQADSLRFKLLAIVGKDETKKKKIINALLKDDWTLVDVESELLDLKQHLKVADSDIGFELSSQIKEWFNSKPNKLILTNGSILYHDLFLKMSPVGAFKYNSRNKNCVLLLEEEEKLGSRIYYGRVGKSDHYDQEISDIVIARIEEIDEHIEIKSDKEVAHLEQSQLKPDAIGRLFDFKQIKDVVDIDADLKETNLKKEIVSSFIISESLERQIIEFFEDLDKPTHKARTVIGNYGSGKSHLVGFLVSLVENPELAEFISNEKVKQAVEKFNRQYLTVQFELQSGQVELKKWFYGKLRQQLKKKQDIDIPEFDPQVNYDDKENIIQIVELIKQKHPNAGLLVVIDEISDFLATKQKEQMKADLQFLRVVGQVCQDQDLMFLGSMQEDVFSSPKFKDVASEIGRIGERFYQITIHREDIKRVISKRVVPKNNEQKHALEDKFKPFNDKIEDVSRNIDDYVELFPLTPFLIEMFSDLPYFEKRGVIQFAISEIKYLLNEEFPYFITFDRIYDLLESNPNKRNLEEIFELSKAMQILLQKINLIESKYQQDAINVVKGLAVYSLWNKREKGATAQELANNLMLLPQNKNFSAADNIALIVKKIREVTDGEYIKTQKDQTSGIEYFRFDTKAGIDPEQKITQKASAVSDDEIEYELFEQLGEILELERHDGFVDVFEDECEWPSVKSFRKGFIVFVKKGQKLGSIPQRDYAVVIASPFVSEFKQDFSNNQLTLKLDFQGPENVELLKEIVAIKALLNTNFQKQVLAKKLEQRIDGYERGNTTVTGLKYRLSKLIINYAECTLNGKSQSIKSVLGREHASIPEIIDELKTSLFDNLFNKVYPLHPIYSIQLSSRNIVSSLSSIATDLTRGDFTNLGRNCTMFLQALDLLDSQGYPDLSHSKIAQRILDTLKAKNKQVTDIEKELVAPLQEPDYGLEPEVIHFFLVLMTLLGKVYLQARGGDRVDINSVKEKVKSLAAFETIAYARLQDDYSYDFASRLLNALGLNGTKITMEKERLTAFKEYKEKLHQILEKVQSLERTIDSLKQKQQIYIDLDAVQKEFTSIREIDWQALDIANHTQFGKIESYSDKIDAIVIALEKITNLTDAVTEYQDTIHQGIGYMNDAVNLLEVHEILVTESDKLKNLKIYKNDVELISMDSSKFVDRAQRNPIKGKIDQFKKGYIYDFYLPAYDKYVGKKVYWDVLNTYSETDTFKKIMLLSQLTCINDAMLNQNVLEWNDLKQHQCQHGMLEDILQNSVRCQGCNFPGNVKYSSIPNTLNSIEDEVVALYNMYAEKAVAEVRTYRDNVQFLENASDKELIQTILDKKKLPENLTSQTIQTINKLFKEIDVVEVEQDNVLQTLFPNKEMTTIEDLRKRYLTFEEQLKKGRQESEVRIKLK